MRPPLLDSARNARAGDSALLRVVGFVTLTASIVNITIGGSIFAIPGTLASSLGAAAPLAFLLAALIFVPIVLCMAAAGSRITETGGPYSYVDAAFGRFPGFVVAATLWISNIAGNAGIAAALADQLTHLVPGFAEPIPRALFLLSVYSILVTLNARGVRVGARAIVVFAAAKTLPLLLLGMLGWHYVHPEFLSVGPLPGWSRMGNSLVLVIFAYSGLEVALTPSAEVSDVAKVLPKATLTGIALIIAMYIGVQLLAQGVLGPALAGNPAPLPAVADVIYKGAGGLVVLTAAVSLLGFLQGDILGNSRLVFAMASKGFLPAPLSRVSAKRRSPTVALIAHASLAWLMATAGSFKTLALLSGGTICLVYISCCAAAWQLQRRNAGETATPFRLAGGPLIPTIGILGMMFILATLQRSEWIAMGCTGLAVSALYALARRNGHR